MNCDIYACEMYLYSSAFVAIRILEQWTRLDIW
jgi:hypothetical protein